MRRFKRINLLIITGLFVLLIGLSGKEGVGAKKVYGQDCSSSCCFDWCEEWKDLFKCPPTPTSQPSPEPSLEPSPEPSVEPTSGLVPEDGGGKDGGDGGGKGGPAEAPKCQAETPLTPTLLSVNLAGEGKADLSWTKVDLATHYSISYGLSPGDYIYGVDNTGKVTSFTVGGLDSESRYCFAVRAVNDCAPSGLSNEICTGKVLGAVTDSRVLGISTLGETGSFKENLFYILFIMGALCLGFGIRNFGLEKRRVSL